MPSYAQIETLIDKCTYKWTQTNGVYGRLYTGPSGNSIFLPVAGLRWNDVTGHVGRAGLYWSSTQDPNDLSEAYGLIFDISFNSNDTHLKGYVRSDGLSVRPVTE